MAQALSLAFYRRVQGAVSGGGCGKALVATAQAFISPEAPLESVGAFLVPNESCTAEDKVGNLSGTT